MKIHVFLMLIIIALVSIYNRGQAVKATIYAPLTAEEKRVILDKGTEAPFKGKYTTFTKKGQYHCKQCDAPLYRSDDKFKSGCGWPSFDDEIKGAVRKTTDADGRRTEITCVQCGGHLGHVFTGEGFTAKNTRHCVNSISLQFKEEGSVPTIEKAYFAGGCFWGVEYLLEQQAGVLKADSGYMGGSVQTPSYSDICTGKTGHVEVVEVHFDPTKTSYETLARYFFEIHDPTQANGQGPDIGSQYLSALFYTSEAHKKTAHSLIDILRKKGIAVVTTVHPVTTATPFWKAEENHQDYYKRKGSKPYCHAYTKRF